MGVDSLLSRRFVAINRMLLRLSVSVSPRSLSSAAIFNRNKTKPSRHDHPSQLRFRFRPIPDSISSAENRQLVIGLMQRWEGSVQFEIEHPIAKSSDAKCGSWFVFHFWIGHPLSNCRGNIESFSGRLTRQSCFVFSLHHCSSQWFRVVYQQLFLISGLYWSTNNQLSTETIQSCWQRRFQRF